MQAESLPRKAPKKPKPIRRGICYWIERADGHVLLERRPEKGLLGGMAGFPGTVWQEGALPESPPPIANASTERLEGLVTHTFTHFHLELSVRKGLLDEGHIPNLMEDSHFWAHRDALDRLALPTVMKKVAQLAKSAGGGKNANSNE